MQRNAERKVEAFIREKDLIQAEDRILIGLSGGADSACLVVLLQGICGSFPARLGAFHVNHGIRGAEADRDERFSGELCDRFGIPFYAVKKDVPGLAKEWKMGLEEAGRKVRYEAAERIANENGYTKIALAHHQKDVAETFLFHLFRGSSITGLTSIPAKRDRIIRPLLCLDRQEIEEYLAERGILFCEDSTNGETDYTRNKIRHHMLSYAEKEINAGAVRHVAEAAKELAETDAYLEEQARGYYELATREPDALYFPVGMLDKKHPVIQKRVLHRFICEMAGTEKDITRDHVEAVLGLLYARSGKQVSLPYGLIAERSFSIIGIVKAERKERQRPAGCEVRVPGIYPLEVPGNSLSFRAFSYKKNKEIPKNEYTKWYDYDKIRGTLCLRTYCEGDRLGMLEGSRSVKSLWTEYKIPRELRATKLLLADEKQVLWIPGVRSCDNYRIDDTTETVLEVQMTNGGRDDGSER
ncbi:MAG: tRNA lysidine(34) synthetase TilS [Lachnospiraceae bacterium]|nr:tRNA lysidine(34) synthetase TilS [Lachnospiraceae bacterium]